MVKLERARPPGTRNIAYQRSMRLKLGPDVATENASPLLCVAAYKIPHPVWKLAW